MSAASPPREFLHPRYWLLWAGLGLLRLLAWLPQILRVFLGARLGDVAYLFGRKRRRIVERNLALCFPQLAEPERQALLRRHYRLSGVAALGVGLVWWASVARLERLVRFRDREHYDRALASGQRVILLAPHFLGLEIGGLRLASERLVVSMYKRPRNALIDWCMRRNRERFGKPDNPGNIFRPRVHAPLLRAAVENRRKLHASVVL